MSTILVTPEELLAGKEMIYDVTIPSDILRPKLNAKEVAPEVEKRIRLRPLTVKDVQLILKAAKDDEVLTSILMIQRAVVEPALKQNQVAEMHSGLIGFLVDCINRISGLTTSEAELREMAEAPLMQTFFALAKEFNWTPDQVRQMTIGQILGYLEMLNQGKMSA
jgi:hypothetical protein